MALQNLRSSTADKRPTVSSMSDGQIALNTNATSPGVFFKDSGGSLIKVGPVHIGTTAPNSSPAGSTGNAVGEQWLDTTGGGYVFKIWDGTAWRSESGTFVDTSGDTMTGALILPSGTAAAPALGVGSADNGLYSPGTDQVSVSTNGTQRLTVDSSGRVLIGTTNAVAFGSRQVLAVTNGTTGGVLSLYNSTTATSNTRISSNPTGSEINDIGIHAASTNGSIQFYTNNDTERMRIDSSGNLLIGTSSSLGTGGLTVRPNISEGSPQIAFNRSSTTNTSVCQLFKNGGTDVGSISYTNTATAFNTSSDYRLKENVVDLSGAIDRVKQLAPKRFNFIVDADTTVDGFLAHEAQTVVPEAVTGTHNAVDDDDNPVYQGIDQSKLVPLLTAALQEAIAKIETLEAKVAALEAE